MKRRAPLPDDRLTLRDKLQLVSIVTAAGIGLATLIYMAVNYSY